MTEHPLPTRAAIVAVARRWIGTPYRHRASLEGVGCDCLGLVRGVWREFFGEEPETLPAYAPDWAEAGRVETLIAAGRRHLVAVPVERARPGDVLLFRWRPELPAKHAGILATPDRFVHAYDGSAVVESPLGPWWRRRLAAAFAFPGILDADPDDASSRTE
ncbi:MAG: peptidase P60 [Phyllobacteriaceae bacterium]|nr:peptidase P60 [Phyllobacteriaceae bacterium]